MIFQPFVENSIKHGISSLSDGKIKVKLSRHGKDHLLISIIDNGIGLKASKERQAHRPKKHVSRGMQITADRLALFAQMNEKEQRIEVSEIFHEDGSVAGTKAEILLPIMGAWD